MTNKTPHIFNEGNLKTASDLELLKVLSGDDAATKMLHNECCDLYRTLMLPVCELKALGLKESTATRIKAGIELGRRMFINLGRCCKLVDNSIVHDCDSVTHRKCFLLVMCDIDKGNI